MPSFSGKLDMLVESYEQSKRTPAYKELRAKYKALKQSHHEILSVLSNLTQNIIVQRESKDELQDSDYEPRRTHKTSQKSRDAPARDTGFTDKICQTANFIISDETPEIEIVPAKCEAVYKPSQHYSDKIATIDLTNNVVVETATESIPEHISDANEVVIALVETNTIKDADADGRELTEVNVAEVEDDTNVDVVEDVEVESKEIEIEEAEVEVEVEAEEEVEVEEEEEAEVEVEAEEEAEEEEEAGVYEIEINGTKYFTTNEQDGIVYESIDDDDVGDEIGKFVKGKFVLNK